jgi:hypothetical protein
MKRNITSAVLSLSLLMSSVAVYGETVTLTYRTITHNLSECDFIDNITHNVKVTLKKADELVDDFIDPKNPELYNHFVDRAKTILADIKVNVLDSLNKEISVKRGNDVYQRITKQTHDLATDIYKKLDTVYQIMEKHRGQKNATKLAGDLKEPLKALMAEATLQKLLDKMVALQKELKTHGADDAYNQMQLLADATRAAIKKSQTAQNKVNMSLLTLIKKRLTGK